MASSRAPPSCPADKWPRGAGAGTPQVLLFSLKLFLSGEGSREASLTRPRKLPWRIREAVGISTRAHACNLIHPSLHRLSGRSCDPGVPLGSRAPPQTSHSRVPRIPANLPTPRASHEYRAPPQISRPFNSTTPRVSCAPSNLTIPCAPHASESQVPPQVSRPLMPLGSNTLPHISRPLEPLGSRASPQISLPSGLARPRKSRDPLSLLHPLGLARSQISRPFGPLRSPAAPQISHPLGLARPRKSRGPAIVLGTRTPGTPRPRAPGGARRRWGPRKPRGCRAPPPAPDSLLAGLAVGGHGRALGPLGVHAAQSRRRRGPHLSGGATGRARRSHSYPAPRASLPGAPRRHRGHHPRGGAPHGGGGGGGSSSFSCGFIFFLSPSARAVPGSARPLLPPRAPPPAASPPPAGAALKGAMASARVGPTSRTVGRSRTRSARLGGGSATHT